MNLGHDEQQQPGTARPEHSGKTVGAIGERDNRLEVGGGDTSGSAAWSAGPNSAASALATAATATSSTIDLTPSR